MIMTKRMQEAMEGAKLASEKLQSTVHVYKYGGHIIFIGDLDKQGCRRAEQLKYRKVATYVNGNLAE